MSLQTWREWLHLQEGAFDLLLGMEEEERCLQTLVNNRWGLWFLGRALAVLLALCSGISPGSLGLEMEPGRQPFGRKPLP